MARTFGSGPVDRGPGPSGGRTFDGPSGGSRRFDGPSGGRRIDPIPTREAVTPVAQATQSTAPVSSDLDEFKAALAKFNPEFFNAVDPTARKLVTGIAEGGGQDSAFEAFMESVLGQFGRERQFQTGQLSTQLGRRGIGGSAAINELNRLNRGFEDRESTLVGQLGLQQLGRSDQAIGQLQSLREAELSGISTGLQNLLAIPTLNVAQTAAEAQGAEVDSGGGGVFSDFLDKLI